MGSPVKIYTVMNAKSGEVIVEGTAEQCAEVLGMTVGSFRTMRHRAENGHGQFHIEAVEIRERDWQNIVKLWDDSFSWLRERDMPENPYPCDGCMRRSICEFQDSFCAKWENWYQVEHERVSGLLHTEAKRIVR